MIMLVSIHQPNFYPWLGYFNKMARSDKFIFFNDVQFPKKGGWINRMKLIIGHEERWQTAPLDRSYNGFRKINEISFVREDNWREKFKRTLQLNYSKHPFFNETIDYLYPLIDFDNNNMAEYNINSIISLAEMLGIDSGKCVKSSNLLVEGSSSRLLCSLTKSVSGDSYMCGGGAHAYQDEAVFKVFGIKLIYQNFVHPIYTQLGCKNFIPGLSIIDLLMNVGIKKSSLIINSTND